MATLPMTPDEVVERGEALYRERIRPLVEPQHNGKYLILDVDSGEYEVDVDEVAASNRAETKHPNGTFLAIRVGYPATYGLGSRFGPAVS